MASGISPKEPRSDPPPEDRRRRRRANCPDGLDAGIAQVRGEAFENRRRVWRSDQLETTTERNQVAEMTNPVFSNQRPSNIGRRHFWAAAALAGLLATGCSIRKMAVNKLGDALAGGGTTFASDDDPELVKAAVPFSLKLMESLLAETPNHKGLLFATASGFAQYAFAFVQRSEEHTSELQSH